MLPTSTIKTHISLPKFPLYKRVASLSKMAKSHEMESKQIDNPQAGPGCSGESRPLAQASGCRTEYGGGIFPTLYESGDQDSNTTGVSKRKRQTAANSLDDTVLELTELTEFQKLKRVLNKTPTKQAQEILTVVEAKVGEQLASCMTEVRSILNKSLEEAERQRIAERSFSESQSEDFFSPTANWDAQSEPGVSKETPTESDSACNEPTRDRNAKMNLLCKLQQEILGSAKKPVNDGKKEAGKQKIAQAKNVVDEYVQKIEEQIGIISAATSRWRGGKLAFRTEDLAQCSAGIACIQLNLAAVQREHGSLLTKYQVERAERRILNDRLNDMENRLKKSECVRAELDRMWSAIKGGNTANAEARGGASTTAATVLVRGGRSGPTNQRRPDKKSVAATELSGTETETEREVKTYAKVAKTQMKQTTSRPKKPVWQTPPKKLQKLEVIVGKTSSQEQVQMKEVRDILIKRNIRGLANIRMTKNGEVAMTCRDATQRDAVLRACDESKLQKRVVGSDWPLLRILNCESGFDDEQLTAELAEDTAVAEIIRNYKLDKIVERVVVRRPARRSDRENVVLQLHPAVFKALIRANKVCLGLISCRVEEYLDIPICYKCCQFGHKAHKCENDPLCVKCGGTHESRVCENAAVRCPNCAKAKKPDTQHTARSMACPFVRKAANEARRYNTYSDG